MDTQDLISKYFPLVKRHWLPLSLGALGMMFFAYGLTGLFLTDKTALDEIVFEPSAEQSSKEAKTRLTLKATIRKVIK